MNIKSNDKLKLCFICAYNPCLDICSGPSSHYRNLLQEIVRLGHKVFLITLGGSIHERNIDGVEVIKISQNHVLPQDSFVKIRNIKRILARLLFSLKAYRKIRKLDYEIGIDVVIAPELFAPGFFTALGMGNKLITRIHGPMYVGDIYNERYPFRFLGTILSMPEMIQAKMSKARSVASKHLASRISKDWKIKKSKLEIVPNAIPIKEIRDIAQYQQKAMDGEYMLYFGRLEKTKGVHVISQALRQVFLEKSNISMLFIGEDCGLRKKILYENKDFSKNIIFFDTMPKDKLFGYIKHAKLIVLPSLFENISYACLESMALEKPVVATHGASFEEVIEDGQSGFLVKAGDPEALSSKILECLARDDLERVGHNAYKSILKFDITKITQDHIKFYRGNILETN